MTLRKIGNITRNHVADVCEGREQRVAIFIEYVSDTFLKIVLDPFYTIKIILIA